MLGVYGGACVFVLVPALVCVCLYVHVGMCVCRCQMYRCVHVCAGMCVYLCPLILPGALSSNVFPSSLPTGIYSVLSAALRMDAGFRDPGSEARAAVATAIPWGILAKARRRKRKKESQRPRQGCFRGETWDVWRMLVNGAETDRTG